MPVIRKGPQPVVTPRVPEQRPAEAAKQPPSPPKRTAFESSSFTQVRKPVMDLSGGGASAPTYSVPLSLKTPPTVQGGTGNTAQPPVRGGSAAQGTGQASGAGTVTPARQSAIRDTLGNVYAADDLERILRGESDLGALTPSERDYLLQQFMAGGPGEVLADAGEEATRFPQLAQALGHAFESGAVTPEQLTRLMGPEGYGSEYWSGDADGYLGFASLVAASGSDALRGAAATALWSTAQASEPRLRESVENAALRAAGSSSAAVRQLLQTAGTEAISAAVTRLTEWARNAPLQAYDNHLATTLGTFLQGLNGLPHTPESDALAGSIFLGCNGSLMDNSALRTGLANYLAGAQGAGNPAAAQGAVQRWDAILQNRYARELLFSTDMPLAARQSNLLFFMQRPNFDVSLLNTYEGNLGSIAAHEAQAALSGLDPAQVSGSAQLPPVPPELAGRFPAIANLSQPVTAASLQQSIPNPITPAMAADYLDALADTVARTGDPNITTNAVGNPALAALFNAIVGGNPITTAHLDVYAGQGAAGLHALASRLRASNDPAFAAQALTLGGIQQKAYFDNLGPFVDSVVAQRDRTLAWINGTRQFAETVAKTGASAIGMAVGGPMGAAAANATFGSAFAALDAQLAGKPLSIPNLLAGAALDFGVGALGPVLGGKAGEAFAELIGGKKWMADLFGDLVQGAFETAGGQASDILRDPAKLEELWADPAKRDDMLKAILLGTVANALPWERLTPGLKRESMDYLKAQFPELKLDYDKGGGTIADEAFKAAATAAVMAFTDPQLQARLRAGDITLQQAIAQVQSQAVNLFGSGAPVDPALAEALLRTLMKP